MTNICPKCGGKMEKGLTSAVGLIGGSTTKDGEPQLVFVVAGTPTARNPIKAFRQGLLDEEPDREYCIVGARCSVCGFLEFYGESRHSGCRE